jgi:signal transduction histidine kinase
MEEARRHAWIRQKFFSDPQKLIRLKKGDVLLDGNTYNRRLYHINYGVILGVLSHDNGVEEEVFHSGENMFVGVFSFFSESHLSYARLVALEDTEVAYVESKEEVIEKGGYQVFTEFFVPIIVTELLNRQIFAQKMATQKKLAMQKLMQTSNLAILGEMAAGLAHELNNAIGVVLRKTEWFMENIAHYFKEKDRHDMYPFFVKGLEKGQYLSSAEARMLRKKLEKELKLSTAAAQKLARAGLNAEDLEPFEGKLQLVADRIGYYWDIGASLHDMKVASKHAAHVVKSVKQLGTSSYPMEKEVDINSTIHESIAILKSLLTNIDLQLDLQGLPAMYASHGGLVQVWVNIIKNACESMLTEPDKKGILKINSALNEGKVEVQIIDNGPGLSDDLLPKIFKPNFTTKVGGLSFGLGLGLSIVQKIINSHNGEIDVQSKPGDTMFRIKLPVM